MLFRLSSFIIDNNSSNLQRKKKKNRGILSIMKSAGGRTRPKIYIQPANLSREIVLHFFHFLLPFASSLS